METDKLLQFGIVGLIALGVVLGDDNNLKDLGSMATVSETALEIETEATQANQALAETRLASGSCFPTNRPITPGMMTTDRLLPGTCLKDSLGTTATVNSKGHLINIAQKGE